MKYSVEEELCKGSFGTVYKSSDPETKMPVAVKVIKT